MVMCCAWSCKNRSDRRKLGSGTMKLFRFPKNPERRKEWANAVLRLDWIPNDNSKICQEHFEPEMFLRSVEEKMTRLRHDAIPTIFYYTRPIKKKKRVPNRKLLQERQRKRILSYIHADHGYAEDPESAPEICEYEAKPFDNWDPLPDRTLVVQDAPEIEVSTHIPCSSCVSMTLANKRLLDQTKRQQAKITKLRAYKHAARLRQNLINNQKAMKAKTNDLEQFLNNDQIRFLSRKGSVKKCAGSDETIDKALKLRSSMDLEVDDPISQDVFSSPVATGSVEEVGASQADTVVLSQSQDTQGSQDARTMEVQREFAHLKKYFIFSVNAKDRVEAKCTQRTCSNVLKMQQHSVYNLKRHYKSHHPSLVNELLAAIEGGSKRGRNRRTVAAYQMRGILKKKLKTAGATRWNSKFDALKCLLEQLEDPQKFMEFNELLQRIPKVSVFVEEDVTIMKEYVTAMEPVAACLDNLQAEEKAYMGMFLPSLFIMKLKLEKLQSDGNLSHAKPLVDALLDHNGRQGFKARFGHLFEDDDLLMATALHPHYKLVAVKNMTKSRAQTDTIQRRLVEELAAKSGVEESQLEEREASVEDAPFLQALRQHDMDEMEASQEDDSEKILNDIHAWNRRPIKASMEVTRDMFPQNHREAWMELFIKYNTPLPSSAAVEQLFSMASDVLRAKRSCLTAENFENLIFMKGNMDIIQQHIMSLKIQEEEEK
eukprot:TRINITY_DN646_c0_g1_i10.p1 TRINITY_DN646_c0_g1~~TRINITY_DN646_c0_g1_i10.p1  ORF type:complete len:713 (-),score=162.64 TRINITY_DN646_c0_g1_i10:334-2472(-)